MASWDIPALKSTIKGRFSSHVRLPEGKTPRTIGFTVSVQYMNIYRTSIHRGLKPR